MANRFITGSALVLRVRASGESNREAFFLTAERGLIRATVYGGPKSRLRSYVAPFHSGILYLYHDPVRDSYKVSDFDVASWRPGIREVYERTVRAGAICETILAGHGGGSDWSDALRLANLSFDAMEIADAPCSRRIALHFLWNWAELLGVRPDLDADELHLNIKNPGALRWLRVVENLDPALLTRYTLDDISLQYAQTLCIEILASALGRRLASWRDI
ncbi:MAG: recombination protein O N-terminal domain-containing protein [Spirochaetaceae bacterium]|jgi:DNA repair protein RecO (recombination protein O)|nr:recombination protein O N-terminal domain-containing protein [Spirochaetaceae bacterium]